MDMNVYLGGFVVVMVKYLVWVMNVVFVNLNLDILGVIYECGFIGMYYDWCEVFLLYLRIYDFIYVDDIFSIY